MRVLYTRIGKSYCYNCGSKITKQESQDIIHSVMSLPIDSKLQVLSPIIRDRKGEYRKELQEMRREGFIRARIDGTMTDLTMDITLKKHKRHTIEIVIDRLIIKPGIERQLKGAIETALTYSDTVVINLIEKQRDILFSKTAVCLKCGISYPDITPMFFSFNSRQGACPRCNGIGFENYESVKNHFGNLEENRYCKSCGGLRLRKEALSIRIQEMNIAEFAKMSVRDALSFVQDLNLTEREQAIAVRVLKEVKDRLYFLKRVGCILRLIGLLSPFQVERRRG